MTVSLWHGFCLLYDVASWLLFENSVSAITIVNYLLGHGELNRPPPPPPPAKDDRATQSKRPGLITTGAPFRDRVDRQLLFSVFSFYPRFISSSSFFSSCAGKCSFRLRSFRSTAVSPFSGCSLLLFPPLSRRRSIVPRG